MSLRAMLWALNDAPVEDPATVLVLIALADNANEDGTGAWPAVALIAARARCSVRTAQRHLNALKANGIIREGNQALVARYPANRRPTVYDLNLSRVRPQIVERPGVSEWHPTIVRGDTAGTPGVTPEASRGDAGVTQTVQEPPTETVQEELMPAEAGAIFAAPAVDDGFDAWWEVYPRKTAKEAARRAYKAALKKTTAAALLAGAERYRADRNRTPQFTAYPATWLNGGRWDDEQVQRGRPTISASGAGEPEDEHFRAGGTW